MRELLNTCTLSIIYLSMVVYLPLSASATSYDSTRVDSLEKLISTETDDSVTYSLLDALQEEHLSFDRLSRLATLQRLLTAAHRLEDNTKIAQVYHKIGGEYLYKGLNDSAKIYEEQAHEMIQNEKSQRLTTDILNNIALIYQRDNEYEKAIETYQQTIMVADTIGLPLVTAYAKANLMTLYMELDDDKRALQYADDIIAMDIDDPSLSDDDREDMRSLNTAVYLNAGICYNDIGNLDSAETFFNKAQVSLEFQNNEFAKSYYEAYIATNLGDVYLAQADQQIDPARSRVLHQKALRIFEESNALFTQVQDQRGVTISLVNQGKALHELGRYQAAKVSLNQGLALAEELNYKENIRDSHEYLSKNDEALGHYQSANKHLHNYMLYRDSIRNEERDKITEGLEVRFQTAQKESEIKKLELERAIADREQTRQRSLYLFSLLGVLGLGYYIYSRMRYKKQQELTAYQETMNTAMAKFVPTGFLKALGVKEITEVKLGDRIESEVTVVFTDIRSFTVISEGMTPSENFDFVREYAARMGPIIERHGGFISQYLGDGIMAIFRDDPENALRACIAMQEDIKRYNELILSRGRKPIKVGMGVHTGPLIMGIIGDERRYDATLISDTVNTAAGLEMNTKELGAQILISGITADRIHEVGRYDLKPRGTLAIKGKSKAIDVYECATEKINI